MSSRSYVELQLRRRVERAAMHLWLWVGFCGGVTATVLLYEGVYAGVLR